MPELKIAYNGTDITDDIEIYRCIHEMNLDGLPDLLTLELEDPAEFASWSPGSGDTIEAEFGHLKTGKMYIYQFLPESNIYTIRASSAPPEMLTKRKQLFESARLSGIIRQITERYGIGTNLCDFTNRKYTKISRSDSDLGLLTRLCALDGMVCLVYDGNLVIQKLSDLETDPEVTFEIDNDNAFLISDRLPYSGVEICGSEFTYQYKDQYNQKILEVPEMYTVEEGSSWAPNLLKYENLDAVTIEFYSEIVDTISAGSVINLVNNDQSGHDGTYILNRIRNDYTADKSKIFGRRL